MNPGMAACMRGVRCAWLSVLAAMLLSGGAAQNGFAADPQRGFGLPEEAVKALVTAVKAGDIKSMREVLGPGSEERRVGKECPSKCRSRWSPYH